MDKDSWNVIKWFVTILWYFIMPMAASIYLLDMPLFNALWEYKAFLFIALAAIFNAVMDCIENEHIFLTRFSGLKPEFWSKRESWNKAKKVFGYKFDAWHMAKSGMIFAFIGAAVYYENIFGKLYDFILMGCWYILIFNAFYNYVFALKKKDE